nr:hypothetical protein [Salmonella sp. 40]
MRYVLAIFFVVLLRKFPPVNPPAKSQISRSAPPLQNLSKILTNIFRTAKNLILCKTTISRNASNRSMALAMSILSCDRYSNFEQNSLRTGRRVRADPRRLVASAAELFPALG